ncbi:CBL-interacting serine/threonine-protein kinase 6-like [Chenopodium quinoa]|uniref:CBL-interacting serine/threonine-protein kinase 6-like n=1 Tax=Chenopodium quinoa TaxID=63459 RepID=UPI000B79A452|nr:CBL-interacting serine/threonine-protein kinase 6-like [Chenopodium quinoa]XP_021729695.1 CBL-interacting serine/threonine-protein kinase 6-like [Chenopodium quinoa]XP_021729696.1 CBL-interacting serine/threonine-protein kinase 6-like [Chenopodium quinoa]
MMGEFMLAVKDNNSNKNAAESRPNYCKLVMQGKYELGRVLGQGTFARVYYARNLESGKSVAMKVVGKEKVVRAKMMDQMKREISVMKRLKHPNIVELYEVMATKSKIFLALELVRGGELHAKVSKEGKLEEHTARSYFRQLISAVDYCHSRGVFHRDLKLENLLLDQDDNLKITDFGLSAFFEEEENNQVLLRTTCGTPHYVAPEVVSKRGQGYDGSKADIWSCGVILFVLLAGYLPFHDENIMQMYRKVYKGDFTCPTWFSAEARELITRMLDPNPATRITLAEIMESKWFKADIFEADDEEEGNNNTTINKFLKKEVEALNAFHIISMSEGLDLSALFSEEKKKREEREEIGFTTTISQTEVISRLEELAALSGKFKVSKVGDSVVRLQGQEKGRKGRLVIVVELFAVSSSFLMVEVKKDSGDTLEFNRFCQNQLRPALLDVIWTTAASDNHTIPPASYPCVAVC